MDTSSVCDYTYAPQKSSSAGEESTDPKQSLSAPGDEHPQFPQVSPCWPIYYTTATLTYTGYEGGGPDIMHYCTLPSPPAHRGSPPRDPVYCASSRLGTAKGYLGDRSRSRTWKQDHCGCGHRHEKSQADCLCGQALIQAHFEALLNLSFAQGVFPSAGRQPKHKWFQFSKRMILASQATIALFPSFRS
ncbi:hypothetical protein J6590_042161 [Homalodisca vitripennis]|nr:hypothetical protein J6590_042161 [Homalodisca vitripennis]